MEEYWECLKLQKDFKSRLVLRGMAPSLWKIEIVKERRKIIGCAPDIKSERGCKALADPPPPNQLYTRPAQL